MNNKISSLKLNKEEQDILKDIDSGSIKLAKPTTQDLDKLQQAVNNSLDKKKSVTIRISERDFQKYKQHASKLGIGHLTLMSSVLHQEVDK